jgi:4-amino-4-deoxy-L-arabinose transferase-like glycosyltransferase
VQSATRPETGETTSETTRPASIAKILLVISAVAFVIRAAYVLKYGRHLQLGWDATWYTGIGDSLADGRGYSVTCPVIAECTIRQTALFPPVLPVIFAAAAKLGLSSLVARQLLFAAIGAITVFLVGWLGYRVGGRVVAIIAAALAAVNPMMILLEGSLMSEPIIAPLAATALILLVDQMREARTWRWIALGALAGVAALTRGEGPLWLVVVVIPSALVMTRLAWSRRLQGILIATVTMAVVVSPWMIRNAVEFDTPYLGQPNLYGTLAATNCDAGYYGSTIGGWVCAEFAGVGFAELEGSGVTEPEAYEDARERAFTYAGDHVSRWPVVVAAREARAWTFLAPFKFQTGLSSLRFLVTPYNWFLLIGGVAGMVLAVRRKLAVWPLFFMVGSVTLTIAATYGNPRYLASATPAMTVFAALAAATLYASATRSSRSSVQ